MKILKGYQIVMIDTSPCIYFIEKNLAYIPIVGSLFREIDKERLKGITSVITLIETLTQPLRKRRFDLIKEYKELFLNTNGINTFEIDVNVGEKAAELRAKYNLRLPDAIQLAVGITKGADAFITNDEAIRKVKEIKIVVLKDFVESSTKVSN